MEFNNIGLILFILVMLFIGIELLTCSSSQEDKIIIINTAIEEGNILCLDHNGYNDMRKDVFITRDRTKIKMARILCNDGYKENILVCKTCIEKNKWGECIKTKSKWEQNGVCGWHY